MGSEEAPDSEGTTGESCNSHLGLKSIWKKTWGGCGFFTFSQRRPGWAVGMGFGVPLTIGLFCGA
jgi:hypothetical protein